MIVSLVLVELDNVWLDIVEGVIRSSGIDWLGEVSNQTIKNAVIMYPRKYPKVWAIMYKCSMILVPTCETSPLLYCS